VVVKVVGLMVLSVGKGTTIVMAMRAAIILSLLTCASATGESVLQKLQKKELAQYSEFADLLSSTEGIHRVYLESFVTVFAPSNAAMKAFKGPKDENFILNHMVSSAVNKHELGERLQSVLSGHPPLWVRTMNKGTEKAQLYVNQARVKFVFPLTTDNEKKQFLYLIDSVLEPLVPSSPEDKQNFVDIKAGDLLARPDRFRLGGHSIHQYASRLAALNMEKFPELSSYGKFTFFVPIDSAFDTLRVGTIDEEVVRAHIVPDALLFSPNPPRRRTPSVATLQYNNTRGSLALRVMAKVFSANGATMVESQTVVGTKQHGRGTVDAQIIKADIPVQNGIVHLISKPLVIMASTIWEHLDPTKPNNQRFKKFAEYVHRSPALAQKLEAASRGTVFIPTNEAFKLLPGDKMDKAISADLERILGLHFLDQSVQSDDIRIQQPQNDAGMYSLPAAFPPATSSRIWLWQGEDSLQVDGGGVQAEVVEADVGASNGVIHSINRVLGVPVDTVYEKLAKDPMMTKTFDLGNQEHFNDDFKKVDEKFTYLVPTDKAWEEIQQEMATAHKVLFMGEFFYQSEKILKRHLRVGSALSLSNMTRAGEVVVNKGPPLTVSQTLQHGETVTTVSFDGITARVVRGDLECTNGYIHLLDRVIMKRRDVTLAGADIVLPSFLAVLIALLL